MQRGPLWECSRCGRRFANRNQSHACGSFSLDAHFAGKLPLHREIFDAFVSAIQQLGPVTVLPQKCRIAFQVRMSFAQLTPRRQTIDGHLVLSRRVESPLFRKIDSISKRNHVHHFRLSCVEDITPELVELLSEAYHVGEQKHLDPR